MRPIHAAFKSLTLLVLLAAGTRADEEADYQASVECANNRPGSPPQAMFANNNDRSCQCMPAATNNGAWTKCPAPAGSPRTGLAICVTGAGCRIECAQDAIPINGTCISYNMAPGAQIKTLTDEDCARAPDADPTDVIGAYQGGSCLCKAPNWHTMDGGSVCKQGIPENAFATCSRALRDDREVGDSYCSFQCKPGFRPSDDQESCIAGAAPAEEATGSDNNNADLAPSCPEVKSISYSSLNARCGCESRMALAKRRTPDATQCLPPTQHGRAGCKNVGAGSVCSPNCDAGYKPSADNTDCVPARANVTISELECDADAGAITYLSADPTDGCVCKDEEDDTYCGSPLGDDLDAEMLCHDTTDSLGTRDVRCGVKCSEGFLATDPKTCAAVDVEGESVTMAATASPQAGEVGCSTKVYKLPGTGGCKCAAEAPAGGEECVAGANAYPLCLYERGSGEDAVCGIACVPGKNLFGNRCR